MTTEDLIPLYRAAFEKRLLQMFDESLGLMAITNPKTNPFMAARMKASFARSARELGMGRYLGEAYRVRWFRYEPTTRVTTIIDES